LGSSCRSLIQTPFSSSNSLANNQNQQLLYQTRLLSVLFSGVLGKRKKKTCFFFFFFFNFPFRFSIDMGGSIFVRRDIFYFLIFLFSYFVIFYSSICLLTPVVKPCVPRCYLCSVSYILYIKFFCLISYPFCFIYLFLPANGVIYLLGTRVCRYM